MIRRYWLMNHWSRGDPRPAIGHIGPMQHLSYGLLVAMLGASNFPVMLGCSTDPGRRAATVGDSASEAGTAADAGSAGAGADATGGARASSGGGVGGINQAGAPGSAPNSTVGPRLIGRFDLSAPSAPVFAWSGSAVALRFTGSAIGVTLGDAGNNVFEVVIDGQLTTLATRAGKKTNTRGQRADGRRS